jgi:uncharacterized protein YllA (UPF0747 family)
VEEWSAGRIRQNENRFAGPAYCRNQKRTGDSDYAKKCGELLEDCYLEEQTIAKATRKMLYHFFAEDGLVIVDGDDAILKRLFMPVIENELLDQFSFPVVNESIRNFSENYPSQISPREINLFYLDAELRQRIVKEGDKWKVLNTGLAFSEEQLKDLIHSQPEKFSPNVVSAPDVPGTRPPQYCIHRWWR